jgi:hypothetical protein
MSDIRVSSDSNDPRVLQKAIEDELEAFNAWFAAPQPSGGLGNAPLIGPELVLLRTYLTARLSGRFSPHDWMGKPPLEEDISDLFRG